MGCDVGDGSKETAFYRSTLTVSTLPFIWRENVLSPRRRTLKGEGSLFELRWKWHWHMRKKSPLSAQPSYYLKSLGRFPIPSRGKSPPSGKGATTGNLSLSTFVDARTALVNSPTTSTLFKLARTFQPSRWIHTLHVPSFFLSSFYCPGYI